MTPTTLPDQAAAVAGNRDRESAILRKRGRPESAGETGME